MKSIKRRRISAITTVALVALIIAGAAFNIHASGDDAARSATIKTDSDDASRRERCTNASLKGDYGFTARGVTLPGSPVPPPLQGAFASSGKAVFDGRGNFTLTATNSFNGVVQGPVTVHGTYSVNEDCTYTSQAENGATFRAVIVNDGREIFIIQTTPGVAITGIAQKF